MSDHQGKTSDSELILFCSTCGLEIVHPKTPFCTDCGSKLSLHERNLPDFLGGLFFVLGAFIGLMLFGALAVSIIPDGFNDFVGFSILLLFLIAGFIFGGLLGNKLLRRAWRS